MVCAVYLFSTTTANTASTLAKSARSRWTSCPAQHPRRDLPLWCQHLLTLRRCKAGSSLKNLPLRPRSSGARWALGHTFLGTCTRRPHLQCPQFSRTPAEEQARLISCICHPCRPRFCWLWMSQLLQCC